jgi:integration host factor subunit alpha
MSFSKGNLVKSIYGMGYSKSQSTKLVNSVFETITNALEKGENVLIREFGKFCVKDNTERRGRKSMVCETGLLAQRRIVTFRCSSVLRDKINGNRKKKQRGLSPLNNKTSNSPNKGP